MWDVSIWVNTKGWKSVGKFVCGEKAIECAREFLPLEVRITPPASLGYRLSIYAGLQHVTKYIEEGGADINYWDEAIDKLEADLKRGL